MTKHPLSLYENSPSNPERALWAAVVVQAIKDAKGVASTSPRTQEEARSWLSDGQADWICHLLELNPGEIQRFIDGVQVTVRGSLSARLYAIRMLNGLSQNQVAKEIGISHVTVSSVERNPNANIYSSTRTALLNFIGRYENGNLNADN